MTHGPDSANPQAFPERLTEAIPVTVSLGLPLAEALSRLRIAVEGGAPVDEDSATSDRRLTGHVSAEAVRLSVADSDWAHRRKGWKIEFVGRFGTAPEPATLRGSVDIANHRLLRGRIWLLRLAALVPLGFGIASALAIPTSAAPPIFDAVFGVGIGFVGFGGAYWVSDSIERAAADDAQALIDYLYSRLA
jgi:hypothetical protein